MSSVRALGQRVSPGDVISPQRRVISQSFMMAYASATWDFARIHYDAAYAADAGLRQPIVDGQALGSLLANLVLNWAGKDAALLALRFRNAAPIYAGDELRYGGSVVAAKDIPHCQIVHCDLWMVNQRDDAAVDNAGATLRLPNSAWSARP